MAGRVVASTSQLMSSPDYTRGILTGMSLTCLVSFCLNCLRHFGFSHGLGMPQMLKCLVVQQYSYACRLLGVGRDGSFEEVQDARNYLYDVSPLSTRREQPPPSVIRHTALSDHAVPCSVLGSWSM